MAKNALSDSNKLELEKSFGFRVEMEDFNRSFHGLQKSFDNTIAIWNKLRNVKFIEDRCLKDAKQINSAFQQELISRKEAKELFNSLKMLIGHIEKDIKEIISKMVNFTSTSERIVRDELKNGSHPIDEVFNEIVKKIEQIEKSLPRVEFGILNIDITSILDENKETIKEFLYDHLNGVIVFPVIKVELKIEIPSAKYETSFTEISKNIVVTFKTVK